MPDDPKQPDPKQPAAPPMTPAERHRWLSVRELQIMAREKYAEGHELLLHARAAELSIREEGIAEMEAMLKQKLGISDPKQAATPKTHVH